MLNSKELYDKVERRRKDKGLTVNKLSMVAGISHGTLNSWKTRGTMPKLEVLDGLCNALEIPLVTLLFDIDVDGLTGEEMGLLTKWKKLKTKQKRVLLDMINAFMTTE